MNDVKNIFIDQYTYPLPQNRIAIKPLAERDSSKCLIFEDGKISEMLYRDTYTHVEPNSLLFRNTTKVIQARILFPRLNSKPFEVFCLEPAELDIQQAMSKKQSIKYLAFIGGAKKWKTNPQIIHFSDTFSLKANLLERMGNHFLVEFEWDSEDTFAELLERLGNTPIPPYLNRKAEKEDKIRYQTVYAEHAGSVAAPTAGLHFTKTLLDNFKEKNVKLVDIVLHVGAGTFKPVSTDTIGDHEMHAEPFEVSRSMISTLLNEAGKLNYVIGTTSLRSLESVYWMGNKLANKLPDFHIIDQWTPYEDCNQVTVQSALQTLLHYMENHSLETISGITQLLIAPGYKYRLAHYIFTNFHQPNSTLLLLVAAAIGEDWKNVYNYALEHSFRFLSYGDGSLLKIKSENRI